MCQAAAADPCGAPGSMSAGGLDVHPLLAAAFRALDRSGVTWALIRGADDLRRPAGDVDLLVDAASLSHLDEVLAGVGFRRLGQRGHGSHRFYFAYDPVQDLWVKLDAVSRIEFGRYQQLSAPLAAGCLERRDIVDGIWRLHQADEAWLLLLHLLLDKGKVPANRCEQAAVATARALITAPVATFLDVRIGRRSAQRVLHAVRAGRAAEEADRLGRRWARRHPVRTGAHCLVRRAARRLDLPVPGHPAGLVVALVGPDGAGKTTLCRTIAARFPTPAASVYMGIWGVGRWDARLHRLIGGRLIQRATRVVRSSLTSRYHRRRGRLVLLDRFAQDVLLPGAADTSLGGRIVSALALWLSPDPATVIVLDAPGEVMFARKGEHSAEVLEQRRRGYLQLARQFSHSVVLDAAQSPPEVASMALAALWARFAGTVVPEHTGPVPFQPTVESAR